MSELYIGLMSGTSMDGVDAVLVDFSGIQPKVLGYSNAALPDLLRQELLALNLVGGINELHRAALAANALVHIYADQVQTLIQQCGIEPDTIAAIGAHGQTVRHRPQECDGVGYTLQLNQPALLAELCGIDVVADFRNRDLAAGGQGAPLVPAFHQAVFGGSASTTGVLNVGGISNITIMPPNDQPVIGFDCGPGNALMDAWCHRHTGRAFDDGGAWAAEGSVSEALLHQFQREPYFSKPAPKSTGRDLFNMHWLEERLAGSKPLAPIDVQSTLTELTAWACAEAVAQYSNDCHTLIVCGGGAFNLDFMRRLQSRLPHCEVLDSARRGLPAMQVEATAFAWLARQAKLRKPGNLPSATGARGPRVLGALYPR